MAEFAKDAMQFMLGMLPQPKKDPKLAELQKEAQDLERQLAERVGNEESAATAEAAAQGARKRQRALAAMASGRRSTILTAPLGLKDEPRSARRTLLGA